MKTKLDLLAGFDLGGEFSIEFQSTRSFTKMQYSMTPKAETAGLPIHHVFA